MPAYEIELSDGRVFEVEADGQPSEADILAALGSEPAAKPAPKPSTARLTNYKPSLTERVGRAVNEVEGIPGLAVGAGKAALETVGQLGSLARMVPGVSALDKIFKPVEIDTEASNPDQEMGKRGERIAELAGAAKGLVGAGRAAASQLPSAERAGAALNEAAQAAKAAGATVDLSSAAPIVERLQSLREVKAAVPRSVQAFMRRVEAGEPITFDMARNFESVMGGLSASEKTAISPAVRHELNALRSALREAVTASAETVGKGSTYTAGVSEYAKAARNQKLWNELVKHMKAATPYGAATAAGAYIGSKAKDLVDEFLP